MAETRLDRLLALLASMWSLTFGAVDLYVCKRRSLTLYGLIQTAGSTPAVRRAAAEQIGDIVRFQPTQRHSLVKRVSV